MNDFSLSNKVKAGYGIGDFAICLYWSGVGLYLLYFYTDVVGISPFLAGWIYALGIAWDAITDPFMGYLAERTRTKMGSYRPYMFYGSFPLAFSFALLFWAPPFEGNLLFLFLLVVNIFHRSCFTIVSVPYSSLTARMTDDSNERTKLTTARMIGASFGTLAMSALGFPLIAWYGQGNEALGFVFLGGISGLIAVIILGVTIKSVRERKFELNKEKLPSFNKVAKSVANNYPFWIVFCSILILGATAIMFNKNLIYFVKYSLNMHDYQGLILGVLGATAFISIPFWSFLALKIGKKNAWLFSMSILFAGLIVFYLYPISNISELLVILGFIGFGNGATGILFWSMLPDTIEYGEWKTGIRTESSLYGFMTFAQKGAIAIAALVLGWALTVIEFVPNTIQSVETLMNLKLIMVWVPIVGILISFALICFYPIDSNYHEQLIKEINERN